MIRCCAGLGVEVVGVVFIVEFFVFLFVFFVVRFVFVRWVLFFLGCIRGN